MATLINQKNGKVVIHTTSNVNSNVASFTLSGENHTGMQINFITWSSNGEVYVKRGSNTALYFPPGSTGSLDFAGDGMALSMDAAANVVVTLSDVGFVLLEMGKVINPPATYDYYEN